MKLAVITGASRGLGLALTTEFAACGWQTIGTGRSEQPADLSDGVIYHQFDASNAGACEAFWKQIHDKFPKAEVCLVNNAGGYVGGSLAATRAEDYEQQMHSIYYSAVYMTKNLAAVVPQARIINVVSTSALSAHKNNSAYGAAKAAEKHFFQSLQEEFKPEKYQITNLYPSDIASHGPNPDAISAQNLAGFVRELAESEATFYLRDATMYPVKRES